MAIDQDTVARAPSSGRHILQLALSVVVIAVVLYFLARVLYGNWNQVKAYHWQLNLPVLALATVMLVGSYLVDIGVWWQAVKRMGEHITYPRAVRLYFTAGLAKYIPGNIWQFFGWFYLAQRAGMSKVVTGTSLLLCQAISALAGAVVAIVAFAAWESRNVLLQLAPLLVLLPLAVFFLQPRIVSAVLNWGLVRIGRQPVSFDLSLRDMVALFVFYVCSYGLWGAALFLFTNAMTPLPLSDFIPFQGVFPAAYTLGLLAPFAPAGLGVREGALTYLLSSFVPLPIATVIALLTRPWLLGVEIVGAALSLLSYARESRRARQE